VEGAITNLTPLHISLKKPKKYTKGYYTASNDLGQAENAKLKDTAK
jgi:hypothetical protein